MALPEVFSATEMMPMVLAGVGEGQIQLQEIPCADNKVEFIISFIPKQLHGNQDVETLVAMGEADTNAETALKGTLVCSLVAIRDMYGLSIGDYSYTRMLTKYEAFMEARHQLQLALNVYSMFNTAANKYRRILAGILSESAGKNDIGPTWYDSVVSVAVPALSAFDSVDKDINTMIKPESIVKDAASFFNGVSVPRFNEEASFFLIRLIFDRLMRRVNGNTPIIRTMKVGRNKYRSQLNLACYDIKIFGDESSTENGSRVQVMLQALQYIEANHNIKVHDMTHEMLSEMNRKIENIHPDVDTVKQAAKKKIEVIHDSYSGIHTLITSLDSASHSVSSPLNVRATLTTLLRQLQEQKTMAISAFRDMEAFQANVTFNE